MKQSMLRTVRGEVCVHNISWSVKSHASCRLTPRLRIGKSSALLCRSTPVDELSPLPAPQVPAAMQGSHEQAFAGVCHHNSNGVHVVNNGHLHANGHSSNGHAHQNGTHVAQLDPPAGLATNGHHSTNGHEHSNGHQYTNGHSSSNGHHLNGNGHTNGSNGLHAFVPEPSDHAPVRVVAVNGVDLGHTPLTPISLGASNGVPSNGVISNGSGPHHAVLHAPEQEGSVQLSNGHALAAPAPQEPSTAPAQEAQQQQQQPAVVAVAPEQQEDIPRPILVISLVSACLTMASCVFNTLLPIYMVTELKMNMRSMGMFEGFLEAFAYIIRMCSGVVSDMMTSRKSAITLGFAMGACAKFGMTGATSVAQLFASKAVDRLANGVQAAPRDALISDLAPEKSRSACFGFAQSMRKWGSFIGAGMSYFLMKASDNNYKLIFLMASSITVASTIAFVTLVPSHARPTHHQPPQPQTAQSATGTSSATDKAVASGTEAPKSGFRWSKLWSDAKSMGGDFYRMLFIISLYGMGHINESMLEARAIEVGFGKAESTLVVALLALTISLSAWPLGQLDDKHGPRTTFGVGMSALIAGNLVLMLSSTQPWAVFGSCLLLGVHWAVIQGPLLSIVVSLAPPHLRGTAFGIFYTVMAATTVVANSMYGTVWHTMGASSAFMLSAGLMVMALLALPYLLPDSMKNGKRQVTPVTLPAPTPAPA